MLTFKSNVKHKNMCIIVHFSECEVLLLNFEEKTSDFLLLRVMNVVSTHMSVLVIFCVFSRKKYERFFTLNLDFSRFDFLFSVKFKSKGNSTIEQQ